MKLKHNCVRDILIYCENSIQFGENLSWQPIFLKNFCDDLPKHSRDDIAYTLLLLEEAGYIEAHIMEADNGICEILVYRLTYSGHEFIDVIKSDTVWKKMQSVISSVGSVSLPILQDLGNHYLLEYLTGK